MLFADVKGSMELVEQLDPEAWSADATRRELSEAHRLFAAMGAVAHAERIAREEV